MKSRASQSSNLIRPIPIMAAALLLLAVTAAAVFFCRVCVKASEAGISEQKREPDEKETLFDGWLTLRNAQTGDLYARYQMNEGDWFSVGFIHSVNKSPLTDYYEIHDGLIYVEKTVYYGFGAGVQTELEEGQTLEYGEDCSMIVSGFHRQIPDLIYIVGTVSDHTLVVNGGEEISLRDLCGRHSKVRFSFESLSGEPVTKENTKSVK